jgi:hypothetical protein
VREVSDLAVPEPELLEAGEDALAVGGRRRGRLRDAGEPVLDRDDVGERATDVQPDGDGADA